MVEAWTVVLHGSDLLAAHQATALVLHWKTFSVALSHLMTCQNSANVIFDIICYLENVSVLTAKYQWISQGETL